MRGSTYTRVYTVSEFIENLRNIVLLLFFNFKDLCSEIKCGIDAVKTPHVSKPEECTCKCPEEAKGDPFFKCEGKLTSK
jgi:hypothetical protein